MAEFKNPVKKGSDRFKNFVAAFMQGNGQNDALQYLLDKHIPVSIFLITGVKFDVVISAFDQYTISIVDVKNHQQMIYKDKISTLALKKQEFNSRPSRPKNFNSFNNKPHNYNNREFNIE